MKRFLFVVAAFGVIWGFMESISGNVFDGAVTCFLAGVITDIATKMDNNLYVKSGEDVTN